MTTPWLILVLVGLPLLGAVIYLMKRVRVLHMEFGEDEHTHVIKGDIEQKKLKK